MEPLKLKEILTLHQKWCNSFYEKGKRADLRGVNLKRAYLEKAYLEEANLEEANFPGAYLEEANLRRANLRRVNFQGAYLWKANFQGANLREANFRGADLQGANLRGADLWGVIGNQREIKSAQIETYFIVYTARKLQIGCEQHSFKNWKNFSENEIENMNTRNALTFWKKWKDWIFKTIEMSPAVDSGNGE